MNRQQFYFLYVNLNSLAELGLQLAAADLFSHVDEDRAGLDPATLSEEDEDAKIMASFEGIDLSALDGLNMDFLSGEGASNVEAHAESEAPAPSSTMPVDPSLEGELETATTSVELDIEPYMSNAYKYEDELRERLDSHYARADLAALDAGLAKLPPHSRALTEQLSAEEMSKWLALYRQQDEQLGDLVVQIRRLDMGE